MGALVLRRQAGGEHPLTLAVIAIAYLRRYMPPWVQALRLFGAAFAFYAAWYHVPAGVLGGLAIVAACWANGILRRRPA